MAPSNALCAPSLVKSRTILLVEDHPDLRLLLKRLLEIKGYGCLEAKNGVEALSIKEFIGDQPELYLLEEQSGKEGPYERLFTDAIAGNGVLFTREDMVGAAWAVVDPVLKTHLRVRPYKPCS